jgi:phosphatidate cytidylyltransferase
MASSLPRRIAVAAVAIPAAFALAWFGGWPLVVALQFLAVVGVNELLRFAERRGARPLRPLALAGALAAAPVAYGLVGFPALAPAVALYGAVGWLLVVMSVAVVRRAPDAQPLSAVAVTVFAPLYAAVLPAFLVVLRHGTAHGRPGATALVFLPLVTIWACDTAAMAGGALIGGPKFAPVVSPKKTWAGTIAGSAVATVAAPLYGWLILSPAGVELPVPLLAGLGLLLSIVGQVGDLAESLFKREAGVKDSGGLFPGHGGVLDRLDSLFWALPTTAAVLAAYGVL